ncbi:hypothetical protein EJ04DRAFT_517173 [Polyplosphaeria fusca]|uniref:Ankyrin repeat protein n=1 Tax=Polyplosphaeria fusca TaxID=682080 RepID=A0A9P4QMM0_9PLEO|nr:hypothetical protein EJ04DRAFT_517173 [Polyplosphaeria fusca]
MANSRIDIPKAPPAPTISVQGATPVDSKRNVREHTSRSPSRPQAWRERKHSFQGRIHRDSATSVPEIITLKEKTKSAGTTTSSESVSKFSIHVRVLHPPEERTSHSVDIVVVYLFNGEKAQPDLALFEAHQNVNAAEKALPSRPPRADGARELADKTTATKNDADLLTPTYLQPSFIPRDFAGNGSTSRKSTTDTKSGTPIDVHGTQKHVASEAAGLSMHQSSGHAGFSSSSKRLFPSINWLKDPDMLPKAIPEARVISIGFNIHDALNAPVDIDATAAQLSENIAGVRSACPTRPILFLAHGFAGILVEQLLIKGASGDQTSESILETTSGLFLFSCPNFGEDKTRNCLATLYGISTVAPLFKSMQSNRLRKLVDEFNEKVMPKNGPAKHTHTSEVQDAQTSHPELGPSESLSRRIGFTIFQYVSADEYSSQRKAERAAENPKLDRTIDRLDDTDSVLVLKKGFDDMMKFQSTEDLDFRRLIDLMTWAVHTRLLLDAATGSQQDMESLESLLKEHRVNVDLRDRWGQTALHIAAQRANVPCKVARILLFNGHANPSPKDRHLNTPLHYAVRRNDIALVQILLDAKADLNCENEDSQTPFDLAKRNKSTKRIAKLLRQQRLTLVEGPAGGFTRVTGSKPKAPISREGQIACKSFQITATEIFSYGGTDHYWSLPISVQEMVYGWESLENILAPARPQPAESVRQERPLCRWLHVHENNMTWVEDLFAKLGYGGSIWAGRGHTSPIPQSRAITPHVYTRGMDQMDGILAIFTPYISYEVNETQTRMNDFVRATQESYNREAFWRKFKKAFFEGQSKTARSRPHSRLGERPTSTGRDSQGDEGNMRRSLSGRRQSAPEGRESPMLGSASDFDSESGHSDSDASSVDDYDIDEEYKAMISQYLNDPPALHVRRTLDQYYYHMLPNTRRRDKDQVVTRWAHSKREEIHNIIMVDQLWLWQFKDKDGTDLIISCFPDRTGTQGKNTRNTKSMDKLRDLVLDPIGSVRNPVHSSTDLIFRIIATCSNIFDRCQEIELLQFLQAFEISIGRVSNKETRLFKKFQKRSEQLHTLNKRHREFETKKNELLEQLLDIGSEITLLVEIKDILDEINIILNVLQTQNSILSEPRLKTHEDLHHSEDARRIVATSTADFTRMQVQAEAVKSSLNALMDLKQKAANAWEAKSSREGAVATARQGNTMLVFTIVTIIFLPLSFMASFFALDVTAFPQDSKGQTNWPLHTVGGLLFGISFAVSIPFIIIAFSVQPMVSIWKSMTNDGLMIQAILFLLGILQRLLGKLRATKLNKKRSKMAKKLRRRQSKFTVDLFEKKFEDSGTSDDGNDESATSSTNSCKSSSGSEEEKEIIAKPATKKERKVKRLTFPKSKGPTARAATVELPWRTRIMGSFSSKSPKKRVTVREYVDDDTV